MIDLDLKKPLEEYNEILEFLTELVEGVVEHNYINTLLISGTAGLGKSYTVHEVLSKRQEHETNPIRYTKFTGHITPFSLYENMKENSASDCVILLDDSDVAITNPACMDILKAASERTPKRRINWSSSYSKDSGFDFEGKLIIITNIVLSKSPHLQAVKDRMHLFNMDVSYIQKLAKIQEIANKESDETQRNLNNEIILFLHENEHLINTDKITIRTFKKLTEIAQLMPHKWKRCIEVAGTYLEKPELMLLPEIREKRKYTRRTNV